VLARRMTMGMAVLTGEGRLVHAAEAHGREDREAPRACCRTHDGTARGGLMRTARFLIKKMDCPTEEQLIRKRPPRH
jgi:hypothetical protein